MVRDEYFEFFTNEYSKLEARYAQELKRSNPGSSVNVELCIDDFKEGKRVFKRMYVCLDACKKRAEGRVYAYYWP